MKPNLGKIWGMDFSYNFSLRLKPWKLLAGWTGLEPAASAVTGLWCDLKSHRVFPSQNIDFTQQSIERITQSLRSAYGNIRALDGSFRTCFWGKFGYNASSFERRFTSLKLLLIDRLTNNFSSAKVGGALHHGQTSWGLHGNAYSRHDREVHRVQQSERREAS